MEIIVKYKDTLLNYLYNNLNIPKKKIKEYLKFSSIYVDGVCTTSFDYPVYTHSKIIIDTKNKKRSNLPFKILYEDKNIIVVSKPSNMLTIANKNEKERTVYHLIREYLKNSNKNAKVFIVHRLDKDTSGVLLFAKNEYIKNLYQKDWNATAKREYVSIVHGNVTLEEDRLVHTLKETKTNLVHIARDGVCAITNYKVIDKSKHYTKLNINIETGRKNQIRVQLKAINHPVVGDKKYGIKDSFSRLYLHAYRLTVIDPITKKTYVYEDEEPLEFKKILNNDK